MLTIRFVNPRSAGHRLNAVEHLLHQLRWLVENNFVVELRNQTLFGIDDWRRLCNCSIGICDSRSVWRWRLEELQNVVEGHRPTMRILLKAVELE